MMLKRTVATMLLFAVTASARTCVVRNTESTGQGSLSNCMEQANSAPAITPFLITFSREFRGGGLTIPLNIDSDGKCSGLPSVFNQAAGSAVKEVIIRAPRTQIEGGHLVIDATDPACDQALVFSFGVDVSVKMSNMVVTGGGIGLLVSGASAPNGAIQESVSLDRMTFADAKLYGVLLEDVRDVSVSNSIITGNGGDGFRYLQFYGTGPSYEIKVTSSRFDFNGDEGLDITATVNPGIVKLRESTFTNNADDGLALRAVTSSSGIPTFTPVAQIMACLFNDNGGEGVQSLLFDIEKIIRSEFNGNGDDGMSFVGGTLAYVYKSVFNGNSDDGIDITEADVTLMRLAEFNNNAQWGIELEVVLVEGAPRVATIKEYELVSNLNNGLGSFICNEQIVAAGRSAAGAVTDAVQAKIDASSEEDTNAASMKLGRV